jgi:hypothetical protein
MKVLADCELLALAPWLPHRRSTIVHGNALVQHIFNTARCPKLQAVIQH